MQQENTDHSSDVAIVVSSNDQTTRAYFTNLIRESVLKEGFQQVEILNVNAESVPDIESGTLWGMIEKNNARFVDTRVTVWTSPEPDAYAKLATSGDMIDAARPQYPTPEETEAANSSNDPISEY